MGEAKTLLQNVTKPNERRTIVDIEKVLLLAEHETEEGRLGMILGNRIDMGNE